MRRVYAEPLDAVSPCSFQEHARRMVRSLHAIGERAANVSRAAEVWRTPVGRFATTAVTLGALGVSAAVLFSAFAVIDQRAAQVLRDGPRPVPVAHKSPSSAVASRRAGAARSAPTARTNAQTVGAAPGPGVAAQPASQSMTGDTGDRKVRKETRHRTSRQERRSARRQLQEPPSSQPPPSQQPAWQRPPSPAPQDGSRSASSFFPFR